MKRHTNEETLHMALNRPAATVQIPSINWNLIGAFDEAHSINFVYIFRFSQ